jgi:hypothetical protein
LQFNRSVAVVENAVILMGGDRRNAEFIKDKAISTIQRGAFYVNVRGSEVSHFLSVFLLNNAKKP